MRGSFILFGVLVPGRASGSMTHNELFVRAIPRMVRNKFWFLGQWFKHDAHRTRFLSALLRPDAHYVCFLGQGWIESVMVLLLHHHQQMQTVVVMLVPKSNMITKMRWSWFTSQTWHKPQLSFKYTRPNVSKSIFRQHDSLCVFDFEGGTFWVIDDHCLCSRSNGWILWYE